MDKLLIDVDVTKGPVCYDDEYHVTDHLEVDVFIDDEDFEIEFIAHLTSYEENHMEYYIDEEVENLRYKGMDNYSAERLLDKVFDKAKECLIDDVGAFETRQRIIEAINQWIEEFKNNKGDE